MTSHPIVDLYTSATPPISTTRRGVARRAAAAVAAAFVLSIGSGAGPLLATASAQSSALEQSLGGAPSGGGVQQAQQQTGQAGRPTGGTGASSLNAAPDFSGPGVSKGTSLIGWAKAGALVIGVLTLTIGIPASKALKEAGNHHASGVRAGAMGVGGTILLAGVAGQVLPWLMA